VFSGKRKRKHTRVNSGNFQCTCASLTGFLLLLLHVSRKDVHGSVSSSSFFLRIILILKEEEKKESLCFFEWRREEEEREEEHSWPRCDRKEERREEERGP